MKKRLDFLLILPLLLAIGFIVFAIKTGSAPNWLATGTPIPTERRAASATPAITSSVAVPSSPTVTRTRTATITATPSARPTSTTTPIRTFTGTSTPSNVSPTIGTGTPASEEINDGIAIGNQIIRALETYYLDNNRYPATLDELVPVYISTIPVTSTGQQYFYRLFEATDPLASDIYWLTFRVVGQEHTTCTYLRRLGYWDCNFASP